MVDSERAAMRWYMRACRAEVEDTKGMEVFSLYLDSLKTFNFFPCLPVLKASSRSISLSRLSSHFLLNLGVMLLLALRLLAAESFFFSPLWFFGFLISYFLFFF